MKGDSLHHSGGWLREFLLLGAQVAVEEISGLSSGRSRDYSIALRISTKRCRKTRVMGRSVAASDDPANATWALPRERCIDKRVGLCHVMALISIYPIARPCHLSSQPQANESIGPLRLVVAERC